MPDSLPPRRPPGQHPAAASPAGSTRGGFALVWNVLRTSLDAHAKLADREVLDILDGGGGTGIVAVPLAELGHRVTVLDPSPNALATLRRRAADAGVTDLINPVQVDVCRLLDVLDPDGFDVALCHGVLEVVDDPASALAGFAAALRPGGLFSAVAANRNAAVLARAVTGRFAEARQALTDADGRWGSTDPMPRRFSLSGLAGLLQTAGFAVRSVHGVRTFADLVPGSVIDGDPAAADALFDLELAVSEVPAFQAVAAHLHLLAVRD